MQKVSTENRYLYPSAYSSYGVSNSTEAVEVTEGALVVGNSYYIKVSGGASCVLPGAPDTNVFTSFVATNTVATYDGAELVNVTAGKPTEILYFYGETIGEKEIVFKHQLGYNASNDCTFLRVTTATDEQVHI